MAKLIKRRSILVKFRNYFFAGVVVLIHLGITLYVLTKLEMVIY